jgi:hypothetical protein
MAAWAVALVFTAQAALAQDHAVPRGGGGGGSSAGQDHHGGGGASASGADRGGSDSGGGSSSGGSSYDPTPAQRRHPRAGTGTGGHYGYYPAPYYGYGFPYYYGSPYYSLGFGYYSPYYYSGFYGYAPSYYARTGYEPGSLRLIVEPREARVYVDGYYAGVVDDFDGIFQRLNLSPGRHDISLRLDGFRTQNFKVYVPYDHTIKIHHKMVPGSPKDATDEVVVGRPEDVVDPRRDARAADREELDAEREARQAYDERREADRAASDLPPGLPPGEAGTLLLDVRPSDASIYVDGAFRGTARLRSLRLTPGRHRVEVVRPGYRTVERDVDVEPGREVEVRLDLERS